MLTWKKVQAGVYETTNGKYRVCLAFPDLSNTDWHLLAADGNGSWDWWNTYGTKTAAQHEAQAFEDQ